MIKKCLVIAPHPDDEINLAGGVFDQLKAAGIYIVVAITTNGDNPPFNADVRIKEAINAKKVIGYDELVILGYGDDYDGKHIYDAGTDEVVVSRAGHSSTYNAGGIETYRFKKNQIQSKYTRDNYKLDLRELILDVYADCIICVDSDSHCDHRALSLLFDEVMGEIIKGTNYRPFILKKFAYLGVFFGPQDYFDIVLQETRPARNGVEDKTMAYPYLWEDRLSIRNSNHNTPALFWKSPVYNALKAHKSQNAKCYFASICNDDITYWYRPVNNLMYTAQIDVSSGCSTYLNDFKIVDTDDVRSDTFVIVPTQEKAWKPSSVETNATIDIKFAEVHIIRHMVIYKPYTFDTYQVEVEFDGKVVGSYLIGKEPICRILFNSDRKVSNCRIIFPIVSDSVIINELEIYESIPCFPWDQLPFNIHDRTHNHKRNSIVVYISNLIYQIVYSIGMRLNIDYLRNKLSS